MPIFSSALDYKLFEGKNLNQIHLYIPIIQSKYTIWSICDFADSDSGLSTAEEVQSIGEDGRIQESFSEEMKH